MLFLSNCEVILYHIAYPTFELVCYILPHGLCIYFLVNFISHWIIDLLHKANISSEQAKLAECHQTRTKGQPRLMLYKVLYKKILTHRKIKF